MHKEIYDEVAKVNVQGLTFTIIETRNEKCKIVLEVGTDLAENQA